MTTIAQQSRRNWWRIARWSAAAALLCVPAIAMRFPGSGFDWTASDFVAMGVLFAAILAAYEFLAARAPGIAYRAAAVLTVLGLFLLIWLNLAVGIIGHENNDANLMFAGVIAIIVGGGCIARFGPAGMSKALFVAAALQAAIGVIALAFDLGVEGRGWPRDVIVLTAFFTGLWAIAGTLYRMSDDAR
ncbi:hypothetical protein [Sphingomonas turrisvirgatae]|uniref:Uncharacterized protein n=1 Tax=Sphingomonas turrisvirgatae TaxID=1888892 RepID=A0A1E3LZG0_9SPHN|nr:hypothetical protein [Sphingomonas turrisvirgatae]ODP38180.1 hypothetical protein BFL28_15205 [Sphingomonas turrisvirgatae]